MCVECVTAGATVIGWFGHVYRYHIKSAYWRLVARYRTWRNPEPKAALCCDWCGDLMIEDCAIVGEDDTVICQKCDKYGFKGA